MKKKLKQILLIDDHKATNVLSRIVINKLDCTNEIVVQNDAQFAIEFLKNSKPVGERERLIFLDINMPGMNGWDFLQEYESIAEDKKRDNIIIMLSNSEDPNDLEKATKNNHVAAYRSKPISKEMIEGILEMYWKE